MGVSAEIYLATSTPPDAVARLLGCVVPGAVVHQPADGSESVVDLAPAGTAAEPIGGPVGANYLSGVLDADDEDDEAEEHPTVDDAYPVLWELQAPADDEEALRRGAIAVFELLAERLACPLLLTFDVDTLLMASLPGEGLTLFADDVTPYVEDRATWSRFHRVPLRPVEGTAARPVL